MLGRAVGEAAEIVKKKIFKHAAALLECDEAIWNFCRAGGSASSALPE